MSTPRHILAAFLVVILLITSGAASSVAQSYTLTIQEGQVFVNGKKVDADEVPASLDVNTMNVHLSFSGTPNPTFELSGRYYVIEGEGLREVKRAGVDKDDTTVIFRNAAPQGVAARSYAASGNAYPQPKADMEANPNVQMQQYVIELSNNARQLNEMNGSLSQRRAQDLLQQLQIQAEQAAQYAQNLPYIEQQLYLNEIGQRDQALYNQLLNELELERETYELAAQARALPEGQARDAKITELRDMLGHILDLKQENRRQEIAQLKQELAILQQRLADREAMKDRMIEKRIQELLR